MDIEISKEKAFAEGLLRFIDSSPTPFHAVREAKARLLSAGFRELRETAPWPVLRSREKYYVTRGGSSLIAFIVGEDILERTGFKIIGAHTDSPTLRLKPNALYDHHGCAQLGVEPYGGGVWRTWLDRDLAIAGRVVVRKDGKLFSRLVDLRDIGPIGSISGLAVHLQRDVNENGAINNQTDLPATIGLEGVELRDLYDLFAPGEEVISFCLSLCDTQLGTLAGMNEEFVRVGRLDNLDSVYQALSAIIDTKDPETTVVAAFWDHEEVGSASAQGAAGSFLGDALSRMYQMNGKGYFESIIARSFLISCDNAHAVLPNHSAKYEARHAPRIGGGPVIKYNANLRYATSDHSAAIFANLCDIARVEYQNYVNRSDMSCGSTIGSIVAPKVGILTVDVGTPQWAMHSIREQAGVNDIYAMYKVLKTFYSRGREVVEIFDE
ncbi:MAG: M18 family aminopeptidase [Candidatus Paceibacterota bacterium]|jgi:aspartyl aminopeptidase|nr:M18 family aminopeptidase [Candidatus Paceibacterota bacterium]